jgi:hypothetical protein
MTFDMYPTCVSWHINCYEIQDFENFELALIIEISIVLLLKRVYWYNYCLMTNIYDSSKSNTIRRKVNQQA